MLNGQVKSVMKNSLVKFSKELNVSLQDFRIKMKLDSYGHQEFNNDFNNVIARYDRGGIYFTFYGSSYEP